MCLLSVVSWGPVRAEPHHRPELNILAQTCACDFGMTSAACSVLSLCCEEPTKKEQYPKLKLIEKSRILWSLDQWILSQAKIEQ